LPGGTGEKHETLSRVSRPPGQYLNPRFLGCWNLDLNVR